MTATYCTFCEAEHARDHMCEPARRVLDALIARGMSFNMPDLEFPAPIDLAPAIVSGDAFIQQLVVQAGVIEVADIERPALIFTGRTPTGPLPRWMYPGTYQDMDRAAGLVRRMADLAVRTVKARRGPR